jgi:predicted permease
MPASSKIASFFRNLTHHRRNEQQLDDEMRSYFDLLVAEKIKAGLTPTQALQAARRELGPPEKIKESVREAKAGAWFDSLAQDLRYAARMLRKNPGFTAIAVLTLALGIGANTAVFTLTDAALLRPLPYTNAHQLVWITENDLSGDSTGVAWPNFQDWSRINSAFSGMSGYRDLRLTLSGAGSAAGYSAGYPTMINGRYVTARYFDLMGVAPLLGRTFTPQENVQGGPDVAVLSYDFWTSQYARSPAALGQTITLNERPFTIVGVMPQGFGAVTRTAVWAPFESNCPKVYFEHRDFAWLLYIVARRKPGVSLNQAREDMNRVGALLGKQYPGIDDMSKPYMKDLRRYMLGDTRSILILLATAVALVLIITCANLAGILLVRMSGRQRELSLRGALGASKWRVLQQISAEVFLLTFTGGICGIFIAWLSLGATSHVLPTTLPLSSALHLDSHALLFTVAATILSSLVFAFITARFALRENLQNALRSSTHQIHGGHQRLHSVLIVCEISLAMAVLVATGLLVRTMGKLLQTDVGFDPQNLLTATVSLSRTDYPDAARASQFIRNSIRKMEQLPGVESASAIFPVPFTPQVFQVLLAVEGRIPAKGAQQVTFISIVSQNCLHTMKVPILQGRDFTRADMLPTAGTVIIDQTLAAQYWPNENPVGRSLKIGTQDFGDTAAPPWKVVGVAGPVRGESIDAGPEPRVYMTLDSQPAAPSNFTFVVRGNSDPRNLASALQDATRSVDRNVPIFSVGLMQDAIRTSQAPRRLAMQLLILFSLAALILATLGLYGVMSYLVGQRTNEIGIRMALGASQRDIVKMVFSYGGILVLGGTLAGLTVSLALGQVMTGLLYQVKAADPTTFFSAAIILAAVALLACYIPARRAMRVDPMLALRHE